MGKWVWAYFATPIVNGTCSGIGCCQIDIPKGLRNINFAAYSFNSHKEVWSFNPCSFAFIIQRGKFNFFSAYLTSLQNNRTLPMVLDWAIGNETCEVALNKGNYYAEQIAIVLITPTVLGTVATARKVTRGTHTSKTVAKVYFSIYLYIYRAISKMSRGFIFETQKEIFNFFHNCLT